MGLIQGLYICSVASLGGSLACVTISAWCSYDADSQPSLGYGRVEDWGLFVNARFLSKGMVFGTWACPLICRGF